MMFSNMPASTSSGSLLLLAGVFAFSLTNFTFAAPTTTSPVEANIVPNVKNAAAVNGHSPSDNNNQDKVVWDLKRLVEPVPPEQPKVDQGDQHPNLEKELFDLDDEKYRDYRPIGFKHHDLPEEEDYEEKSSEQAQDDPDKKNAEYFLRHNNGQYSSLEMAQYVFWTGDEEGVARAVEEFIQKGLMSRENAIKFLKEISVGIEYLENSYANRGQNDQNSEHDRMETSTTLQPTTPKATKFTKPPVTQNDIHDSLSKINEISNEKPKADDEATGRLRIADFLYAEYSLEEVIYQLAKVMFSQSLTRGSEQAQTALQRLTGFLESEGSHGRISPALQKKVLDVLLAALSDCLAEHPELVPVARVGLGNSFDELNKHSMQQQQQP